MLTRRPPGAGGGRAGQEAAAGGGQPRTRRPRLSPRSLAGGRGAHGGKYLTTLEENICAGRCVWWRVGAEDPGSSVQGRGEAGPAEVTSTTRGQGQAPGD